MKYFLPVKDISPKVTMETYYRVLKLKIYQSTEYIDPTNC